MLYITFAIRQRNDSDTYWYIARYNNIGTLWVHCEAFPMLDSHGWLVKILSWIYSINIINWVTDIYAYHASKDLQRWKVYKKCISKKHFFFIFGQQPTSVPIFWKHAKKGFGICFPYFIVKNWNRGGPLTKFKTECAKNAIFSGKWHSWVYITSQCGM